MKLVALFILSLIPLSLCLSAEDLQSEIVAENERNQKDLDQIDSSISFLQEQIGSDPEADTGDEQVALSQPGSAIEETARHSRFPTPRVVRKVRAPKRKARVVVRRRKVARRFSRSRGCFRPYKAGRNTCRARGRGFCNKRCTKLAKRAQALQKRHAALVKAKKGTLTIRRSLRKLRAVQRRARVCKRSCYGRFKRVCFRRIARRARKCLNRMFGRSRRFRSRSSRRSRGGRKNSLMRRWLKQAGAYAYGLGPHPSQFGILPYAHLAGSAGLGLLHPAAYGLNGLSTTFIGSPAVGGPMAFGHPGAVFPLAHSFNPYTATAASLKNGKALDAAKAAYPFALHPAFNPAFNSAMIHPAAFAGSLNPAWNLGFVQPGLLHPAFAHPAFNPAFNPAFAHPAFNPAFNPAFVHPAFNPAFNPAFVHPAFNPAFNPAFAHFGSPFLNPFHPALNPALAPVAPLLPVPSKKEKAQIKLDANL